ncbi:acyltransferase family protein [Ancylomarina sp. 16SWW S1-10-2]|uniref:acyltransferase family protein n=1 Tax=Ancylomarina sp. 16SWW S1-10-2 TaxID=2499681 RepID=UPI0012AE675A|nr:acyltransferase family protein [Ancylomarina sp. 16SWW S1-10-2]MRT93428.1 hypothetical protein [Ancylomarina sp. 16SWW S1-10-2]
MDIHTSIKIRQISFLSIIMVVILHAYSYEVMNVSESSFNFFIQNFISNGIVKIAVPTFFFISGFLFFRNFTETFQDIKRKFKRRINTLILPYFYWCAFWFCFIFILQILPISKVYFSHPLYQMSFADNIWNAFYEPINYPFWFIRELIVYIFLIPPLYFVPRKAQILFLLVIFGVSLIQTSLVIIWKVPFIHFFSFLFFVAGSIAGLRKYSLILKLKLYQWLLISVVWIILIICRISNISNGFSDFAIDFLGKIEIMIGVLTLWFGYDLLPKSFKKIKSNIYSFTFIIYAFHGIPIVIFKKFFSGILGDNSYVELLFYFLVPLVVILLSVFVGKKLLKRHPLFYTKITGGR